MMTLSYRLGDNLYLNITNKCNCACVFCIRAEGDGVGDGGNLWLEREPTADEVISDLEKRRLSDYGELVFCGYGEPTENLDVMLEVCRWLRAERPGVKVRLNTNGLCDLSRGEPVAPLLAGLVDEVSVSLNASDASGYQELTRSAYGEKSFDAMLKFASDCKEHVPSVIFSIVNVLSPEETQNCRNVAQGLGIPLRVREKV